MRWEKIGTARYKRNERPFHKGGQSDVYRASRRGDGHGSYAMRVVRNRPSSNEMMRAVRGSEIQAQLRSHPYVVNLIDRDEASVPDRLDRRHHQHRAVFEFVEGTNLHEALKENVTPVPLLIAVRITTQLAEALRAVHNLPGDNTCHRDPTPPNVLLTGGLLNSASVAKLTDFGLATSDGLPKTGPSYGTPDHEVYGPPPGLDGIPRDIWYVGLTLLLLADLSLAQAMAREGKHLKRTAYKGLLEFDLSIFDQLKADERVLRVLRGCMAGPDDPKRYSKVTDCVAALYKSFPSETVGIRESVEEWEAKAQAAARTLESPGLELAPYRSWWRQHPATTVFLLCGFLLVCGALVVAEPRLPSLAIFRFAEESSVSPPDTAVWNQETVDPPPRPSGGVSPAIVDPSPRAPGGKPDEEGGPAPVEPAPAVPPKMSPPVEKRTPPSPEPRPAPWPVAVADQVATHMVLAQAHTLDNEFPLAEDELNKAERSLASLPPVERRNHLAARVSVVRRWVDECERAYFRAEDPQTFTCRIPEP